MLIPETFFEESMLHIKKELFYHTEIERGSAGYNFKKLSLSGLGHLLKIFASCLGKNSALNGTFNSPIYAYQYFKRI